MLEKYTKDAKEKIDAFLTDALRKASDIDDAITERINPTKIEIDNGEVAIDFDYRLFAEMVDTIIDAEKGAERPIIAKIKEFNEEIKIEKQKGIHLGSTDLKAALNSLFSDEDLEKMGIIDTESLRYALSECCKEKQIKK
jgi:transcription termination factor NusB